MAYSHGKYSTLTVNSVTYPFQNASLSLQSNNSETTNFLSSGDYDSIAGVHSVVLSGSLVADPSSAAFGTSSPVFAEGVLQTCILTHSDGTTTKSCTVSVRWDSVDFATDVNDKVKITVSGKGKLTTRWV